MTNCEVITKADIESDYRLARMTLRMNKRLARLTTIGNQKPFNIKAHNPKVIKEIFEITLRNRFEKHVEVISSNFSEIMKKEATKLADETMKEPPVLSKEDKAINN